MYEALQRLRFEAFLDSLDEDDRETVVEYIWSMGDCFPQQEEFSEFLHSSFFNEICEEYERFIVESSAKSKTFAFWSMYIKMTGNMDYYCTNKIVQI
jgi:hypothetical protein